MGRSNVTRSPVLRAACVVAHSAPSPAETGSLWYDLDATGSSVTSTVNVVTKTADYTLTPDDVTVWADGTLTLTLPTAVGISGKGYEIKNIGTGIVTVACNGSETIDEGATAVLSPKSSIVPRSDNANWWISMAYQPAKDRPLTAFGDLRVAQLSPVFQGTFEYTVDNTELNTNTVTNGGTVTQASAMAVVGTSITTASTARLVSKKHAKYRAGLGGLMRFTALFTSPVAGTEQYVGLADEVGSSAAFKNGYMVGYDGTTFGLHRFQNDVKITTALANWTDPLDGTGPSGMTLDPTKINVFFIQFEYLGGGPINIYMQDDDSPGMLLVHTENYSNANVTPSAFNPHFRYFMWVNNGGTTSDIVVKGASYAFFVEGATDFIELHQPHFASGIREKTTVTSEVAIFTIRNRSLYASKTNFIDAILLAAGASIEASSANNLGNVRLVKNATLGGSPSYSDINTSDSIMEIDTAGTTVTGGKDLGGGLLAGKNDGLRVALIPMKIMLGPGESVTFAGSSVNSATLNASLTWRELF